MLQISRHADYACRVLIYLATTDAELSSIEEIATAYKISHNHLVKVVHKLGKLGFVATQRGRGGGIRLGKAPQDIVIGDVIRATEPQLHIVECEDPETNTCPILIGCGLKPWLGKAKRAFMKVLDEVTLADVTRNKKALSGILTHP